MKSNTEYVLLIYNSVETESEKKNEVLTYFLIPLNSTIRTMDESLDGVWVNYSEESKHVEIVSAISTWVYDHNADFNNYPDGTDDVIRELAKCHVTDPTKINATTISAIYQCGFAP